MGEENGTATIVVGEMLTAQDLADRWGTTVGSLSNKRSGGTGPRFVKLGRRVLYRLSDVRAFEDARLVETFDSLRIRAGGEPDAA